MTRRAAIYPLIGLWILGACSSSGPAPGTLAITHLNVIHIDDGRVVPASTVTIRDGWVVSVTHDSGAPGAERVVDGQERFAIPGLWDMHAHGMASDWWRKLYLANGVTGVRDMGADLVDLDRMVQARQDIASGLVLGPRLFLAGPILDDAPDDWPLRMRVKDPDAGRNAVRSLKGQGVDLIKVHDHTPRDVFFAIADEARRQSLPLAGHVPIGVSLEEVIAAGQSSIEHLSNMSLWRPCSGGPQYRFDACRPFFEMLARENVWQTPTLAFFSEVAVIGTSASALPAEQMAYASRAMRAGWAFNQRTFVTNPEIVDEIKSSARVAVIVTNDMTQAGVGVLAGCDAMIAGFCVHDELAAMVTGGMTPLAALQTATLNPARYLGLQQTVGRIAPGYSADLLLLDGNPLADIANVRRIHSVVRNGRMLDRSELDQLLAEARTAAAP